MYVCIHICIRDKNKNLQKERWLGSSTAASGFSEPRGGRREELEEFSILTWRPRGVSNYLVNVLMNRL